MKIGHQVFFVLVLLFLVLWSFRFGQKTAILEQEIENSFPQEEIIPTYNQSTTQWEGVVHIHFMSYNDLQKELRKHYPKETREVLGFKIDSEDGVCHIFMMKPEFVNDNRTRTMGHELLHCVYGPYHF
jgi:hypothetical protein